MMALLDRIKTALSTVDGVQTCKIGLEDNISPDDYPIIRIVPSRAENSVVYSLRKMEMLIYFGMPIQPFDDTPDGEGRTRLEKLYSALLGMEGNIRAALHQNGANYLETITDEDRLDTYKLMAVRCEVEG